MSLRTEYVSFLAVSALTAVCVTVPAFAESSEAPGHGAKESAVDATAASPAASGSASAPKDTLAPARAAPVAATPAPPEPVTTETQAHDLFKEARALVLSGHYDAACTKFKASFDLVNGIGTEFNLADCFEHVGKNATAAALFRDVAARSHDQKEHDREHVAHDRYTALEPKLDYLVIDAATTPGLEVTKDGTLVDRDHWGARLAVDPGPHEVKASAPSKRSWSKTIDVPQEGALVIVTVPELSDPSKPVAAVAAAVVATPEPTRVSAADAPSADQSPAPRDNTVKLLLLGGIGAGAVASIAGFALYESSNDDAKQVCPTNLGCTMSDVQRHGQFISDARAARAVGFVGLGVAGASVLASGIIAAVRGSKQERGDPMLSGGPAVGADVFGAEIHGRF